MDLRMVYLLLFPHMMALPLTPSYEHQLVPFLGHTYAHSFLITYLGWRFIYRFYQLECEMNSLLGGQIWKSFLENLGYYLHLFALSHHSPRTFLNSCCSSTT